MRELPAPLVFVVDPAPLAAAATPGSYGAALLSGQALLAAELSRRLGAMGAAVARLPATSGDGSSFHWGRWFVSAVHEVLAGGAALNAVGYAGAGALALLDDEGLDSLISPIPGEVAANNRFSADAFVVAGELDAALGALERCENDNAAPRALETAGFRPRDLGEVAFSRFDVDTPQDLALVRLASRLSASRQIDGAVTRYLEMARLPGGRDLTLPRLEELATVLRDRDAELVVAGRVPSAVWQILERDTACRVRLFVEERGMRSAHGRPGVRPRSLLARWLELHNPAGLVRELAALGDAVICDSRVLMAALAGSADSQRWPPAEERYAADFGDAGRIETSWLRELTATAASAEVPVLLGGHALVSDGLRIVVDAAWQGR